MSRLTRRTRRAALAVTGLAAVCALAVPAAAANAAGGYTPDANEWWFNSWHVQQEVWPVTEGAGVTVGVVDSGVQASIPDLRGAVKPGGDMFGEPGDGEKDHGPDGGHGTAMAALIAGQGGGVGVVGIAPQAKILPVHAVNPNYGTLPIANGIRYAVNHGVQVINLSLGSDAPSETSCEPQFQSAVSYALSHDVVVVAASGDTNLGGPGPEQPGTCAGVLAVGGVEKSGSLWRYSTQGSYVSVAAPGDHMFVVNSNGVNSSTTGFGTSDSSALVAGAAALIRSKYPTMPWYTVDQRLIDTAVGVGQVPNNGTGYGIIDIHKALDVAQFPVSTSAPNPPYARYQAYLKSVGRSGASAGGASPAAGGSATVAAAPGKSSGSTVLIVVLVVVAVLIIAVVLVIVGVSRRRGRRNPGGGGGYTAPNGYGAPGQYSQAGQQYPPQAQHPQPGQAQHPAPGQAQYPQPGQAQYPAPGQAQYPQPGQGQQPEPGQGQYPHPGQG